MTVGEAVPSVYLLIVHNPLPPLSLTFHSKIARKGASSSYMLFGLRLWQTWAENRHGFALTFLTSPCPSVLCVWFLLRAEVCAQFVFLTKKNSVCGVPVFSPVSRCWPLPCLSGSFGWPLLTESPPSDFPPQDQGLPSNPLHPQVGSFGSFHDNHSLH